MPRLTLEQRRDARNQLQQITSAAAAGADRAVVHVYINNFLDKIDYMQPPRWQQRLRERMQG